MKKIFSDENMTFFASKNVFISYGVHSGGRLYGRPFLNVAVFGKFMGVIIPVNFTRISNKISEIKYKAKWYLCLTPVYYIVDSRDCDHSRSVTARKARNGKDYVQRVERAYEDAEGPVSFRVITKKEYQEFKPWSRDYISEAYEDGHPYNVAY